MSFYHKKYFASLKYDFNKFVKNYSTFLFETISFESNPKNDMLIRIKLK